MTNMVFLPILRHMPLGMGWVGLTLDFGLWTLDFGLWILGRRFQLLPWNIIICNPQALLTGHGAEVQTLGLSVPSLSVTQCEFTPNSDLTFINAPAHPDELELIFFFPAFQTPRTFVTYRPAKTVSPPLGPLLLPLGLLANILFVAIYVSPMDLAESLDRRDFVRLSL